MNGRFKRLLEPGERILVRSTDGGAAWYLAGAFLALIFATWIRRIWGVDFLGFEFWNATLFMLLFAVPTPLVAWAWTRWKWVITDRRVLKSYGLFSREIGQMRNERVDRVQLGDTTLWVDGRDYRWEFPISRAFCRADILYDLFGARMGDPGIPARPLPAMLEPGETVLWRGSPLSTDLLPWIILLSGPMVLAAEQIWPVIRDNPYFPLNMMVVFYAMFLADVIAVWKRRGWQTVLTDRRLMLRRAQAPSRCDVIPIDDITEAYWNSKGWELAMVSPGRRDTITCLPWTARRILATLERNDRDEALA